MVFLWLNSKQVISILYTFIAFDFVVVICIYDKYNVFSYVQLQYEWVAQFGLG